MNNKKLICILMFFMTISRSSEPKETSDAVYIKQITSKLEQAKTEAEIVKIITELILMNWRVTDTVKQKIQKVQNLGLLTAEIKWIRQELSATKDENGKDIDQQILAANKQLLDLFNQAIAKAEQLTPPTPPAGTADTHRANSRANSGAEVSPVVPIGTLPLVAPPATHTTVSTSSDTGGESNQAQVIARTPSSSDLGVRDAAVTRQGQSFGSDGSAKPELAKKNSIDSLNVPEEDKPKLELTYDTDGKLIQGNQTIFDARNPRYLEYNTGIICKIKYKSLELESKIKEGTCLIGDQQKQYKYASFEKISVGETSATGDDYIQIGRAFAYLNESIKQGNDDLNTQAYCMCEGLEQSIRSIKSLPDRTQSLAIVKGIIRSLVAYFRYYGYKDSAGLDQDTQKIFNALFAAKKEWLQGILLGQIDGEIGQLQQTLNNLGLTKLIHTLNEYNQV